MLDITYSHELLIKAEKILITFLNPYKKKKGQNRNSAPSKIQYPMKNRGENNRHCLYLQ